MRASIVPLADRQWLKIGAGSSRAKPLSQHRRLDPPARLRGRQAARGRRGGARRREQPKAGRARARHAREPAAGLVAQRREHPRDRPAGARSRPARDRCARRRGTRPSHRGRAARPAPVRRVSARPPGLRPSIANTSLVGTATPGLTSTAASFGIASGADSTSPMPRIRRGRGSTQTGTSAPIRRATLCSRGSSSASRLARASRRSAAPASDEPPPSPAATGRRLSSVKRPSFRSGISAASARAALSTRLSSSGPACSAVAPRTLSDSGLPGAKRQAVADAREHHQAVEQVIAVGAAAEHGEREIDLGRGVFDELRSTTFMPTAAGHRRGMPPKRHARPRPGIVDRKLRSLSRRRASSCRRWPRRGLLGQAGRQLLLDLGQVLGLRLEVARVRPLELRLERAPGLPIGVAEMVVDGRIVGLELDRALQVLHRLVVVAEPEIGPAERVDDVAVVRPLLDGAADHPHAVVEIDALVDPRIAEIVRARAAGRDRA